MHIAVLGAFFAGLLFVATSSVAVLAAESDLALAWWSSLFPLAYSHGMAGFLALCRDLRAHGRWRAGLISATISGGSTALSVIGTGWLALKLGPFMAHHIALAVLVLSSLAGAFGLAIAIRLWPDDAWSNSPNGHEATRSPVILATATRPESDLGKDGNRASANQRAPKPQDSGDSGDDGHFEPGDKGQPS